MTLASRADWGEEPQGKLLQLPIVAGTRIYDGAFVALNRGGSRRVELWNDSITTNTSHFLGLARVGNEYGVTSPDGESVVGKSSRGVVIAVDVSGILLRGISIAGSATVSNIGDLVYSTDENTPSIAISPGAHAIGWIRDLRSATDCDVQLWSASEYRTFHGV